MRFSDKRYCLQRVCLQAQTGCLLKAAKDSLGTSVHEFYTVMGLSLVADYLFTSMNGHTYENLRQTQSARSQTRSSFCCFALDLSQGEKNLS